LELAKAELMQDFKKNERTTLTEKVLSDCINKKF